MLVAEVGLLRCEREEAAELSDSKRGKHPQGFDLFRPSNSSDGSIKRAMDEEGKPCLEAGAVNSGPLTTTSADGRTRIVWSTAALWRTVCV